MDYIEKVISEFEEPKHTQTKHSTPVDANKDLNKVASITEYCDATKYRSLVGKLLYAANTVRFDIAYIVGVLSRHFQNPEIRHWDAAMRCLRYLEGTKDYGLCYHSEGSLQVFCDADWGSDEVDRKFITGYLIILAGAPISWKGKKQSSIALSTAEAEYMALAETVNELL